MEILHIFVNLFAGGRSDVKIYLFFIYAAIVSILFFYIKRNTFSRLLPYKRIIQTLSISLSFLFITGIMTHMYLIRLLGLSYSNFFITSRNQEISSSVITHIHTLKGAMALVISLFNKNSLEWIDTGQAFLGLFPVFIFVLVIIFLCIACIGFLFLYIHTLQHKPESRTYVYLISYAIFSFSILKNTIDGGLLNAETIPSIICMYILFKGHIKETGLLIYAYLVLLLLSLLILTNVLVFTNYGIDLIAILSLYILLVYFTIYYKKNVYITLCIIVLSMFGIYIGTLKDRAFFAYAHTRIPAQSKIYIQSKRDVSSISIGKKENLGKMTFYTGTTTVPIKIKHIIKETGVPINFISVSVPGLTCDDVQTDTSDYYIYTKESLTPEQELQLKSYTSSLVQVKNFHTVPTEKNSNHVVYKLTVQKNQCVGRWVEIIQELLQSHGFINFFIYSV